MPPEKFRIHSADVGGGFGVRHEVYPEFLAVMLAAKRTGKPVKWLGTRSETISGDHHGRAADLIGELALDSKGQFLALRVQWLVNLGAFCSNSGPLINTIAAPTSSAISLYNVPAVHGRHRLVFTNTTPTTAYRGAGRPNVAYLWERLVEEAAVATGINSIRLRRRNVLRKNAFPMKTPTGSTYDSGDPARLLDTALKASDWDGFAKRRRGGEARGQAARHRACACFSSRPAAWARSRSSCASSPTAGCRCFRSPVRQGRATRPSIPRWWRTSSVCPRTGSTCATTM